MIEAHVGLIIKWATCLRKRMVDKNFSYTYNKQKLSQIQDLLTSLYGFEVYY